MKSSIVIEGPPGSGKTAATLALCRALMPTPVQHLYYLSTEVTSSRLFKNHSEFGWFGKDDTSGEWTASIAPFEKDNLFFADIPRARTDRPLPSSSDLINEIFRSVAADRRTPNRKQGRAIVVIDSLSGLLRDAGTTGERRRLTEDFLERLEALFQDDLALVFLITETNSVDNYEIPLEQYVADYVIRFGQKEVAGGRRLRTWDVVKSHGTYMEAGEHTWDFFTEANEESIFQDRELRDYVWGYDAELCMCPTLAVSRNKQKSATIVIYPQWATYLKDRTASPGDHRPTPTSPSWIWSGTPGLDEMLTGDSEYWSRPDKWAQRNKGATWTPGLCKGETTLLLGASGTMKTWLSIQFLAGQRNSDGAFTVKKQHTVNRNSLREEARRLHPGDQLRDLRKLHVDWKTHFHSTLMLSFEGESSTAAGFIRSSKDLAPLLPSFWYVSPASLHLNHLLLELAWICKTRNVTRIAIDGLELHVDAKAFLAIVGGSVPGG